MSTICKVFICLIQTIINCSATENQGIFPICFKSNFSLTIVFISIVCPQVAVYTDGIFLCHLAIIIFFISNLNAPAFIINTCFI